MEPATLEFEQTEYEIKEVFDKVLELHKQCVEKNFVKEDTIYYYLGPVFYDTKQPAEKLKKELYASKGEMISGSIGGIASTPLLEDLNSPAKNQRSETLARYVDGSYLHPKNAIKATHLLLLGWCVVISICFFVVLILAVGGFTKYIPIPLYMLVCLICFLFWLLAFIYILAFASNPRTKAIKEEAKKENTFYILLSKINFNDKNKEKIKKLVEGNKILEEIFQVKYGKNTPCPLGVTKWTWFFVKEDGVITFYTKAMFKISLQFNLIIAVVFTFAFLGAGAALGVTVYFYATDAFFIFVLSIVLFLITLFMVYAWFNSIYLIKLFRKEFKKYKFAREK